MQRINNIPLKNHWVNEEIKEEIRKYLETNENKNTTFQHLQDTANTDLRGKYMQNRPASIKKKQKQPQPTNLTYHLKKLQKEDQTKPKVSRRKEIIKIRKEINRDQKKKPQKGSMKPRARKVWLN